MSGLVVRGLVAALILSVVAVGPRALAGEPPEELIRFSEGPFSAGHPDWPEDPDKGPESLVGVTDGQFGVWINRYEGVPREIVREMRLYLDDTPGSSLLGEEVSNAEASLRFKLPMEHLFVLAETRLLYCGGRTYGALVAGTEDVYHEQADTFEAVLESARCDEDLSYPLLDHGKLGMIINPANDDYSGGLQPAIRLTRQSGAQLVHLYCSWGEIEVGPGSYHWDWLDHLVWKHAAEGFEISLVVNVIHTAVRGSVPSDLTTVPWASPEFIGRFSRFAAALHDRYEGQIGYYSIGNEVNDYFVLHRDEIGGYREFFLAARRAIAREHPDVKVAMTFAYHDAESQGAVDIVRELNVGDFTPYTLYIYGDGFRFDREPSELAGYLDRMIEVAGDKPVAIVEIGWNTAESLGGTEEDQADFVRAAYRGLRAHRDRLEYMSWFALHDGTHTACRQAALSFIPHRPDLAEDESFMGPFTDFICYMGLKENEGAPKLGWQTWLQQADRYIDEFANGGRWDRSKAYLPTCSR